MACAKSNIEIRKCWCIELKVCFIILLYIYFQHQYFFIMYDCHWFAKFAEAATANARVQSIEKFPQLSVCYFVLSPRASGKGRAPSPRTYAQRTKCVLHAHRNQRKKEPNRKKNVSIQKSVCVCVGRKSRRQRSLRWRRQIRVYKANEHREWGDKRPMTEMRATRLAIENCQEDMEKVRLSMTVELWMLRTYNRSYSVRMENVYMSI